MIRAGDAIRAARALLGTPYRELDCIGLIVRVIRTAPGGVPGYRTAGTNTLWDSYNSAPKYRDLTWRQEGIAGARAGMLAFKRNGDDVHHTGIVTDGGTVIHSSSAAGRVVETALDGSWDLLAAHRYIGTAQESAGEEDEGMSVLYRAEVITQRDPLRVRAFAETGRILGHVPRGRVVDVLTEAQDGWQRIRYNELVGYASAEYLRRVEDAPEPEEPGDGETDAGDADETATTLIGEDGQTVTLLGRWRVAED